jgi:hypothetical protein
MSSRLSVTTTAQSAVSSPAGASPFLYAAVAAQAAVMGEIMQVSGRMARLAPVAVEVAEGLEIFQVEILVVTVVRVVLLLRTY